LTDLLSSTIAAITQEKQLFNDPLFQQSHSRQYKCSTSILIHLTDWQKPAYNANHFDYTLPFFDLPYPNFSSNNTPVAEY
jgi:hypothetical protein